MIKRRLNTLLTTSKFKGYVKTIFEPHLTHWNFKGIWKLKVKGTLRMGSVRQGTLPTPQL